MSPKLPRYRLLIFNGVLLFALLGSCWGYRTDNPRVIPADCLSRLSLPFRGWTTKELHLTDREQDMLKPDALLLRHYQAQSKAHSGGGTADLAVIAGHRKQTVHTPAACMAGGGWETIETHDWHTIVGNTKIAATRSIMARNGQELVATYFFTDGTSCTQSLVEFQGTQFLQRFRGQLLLGALVRITVPVTSDRAAAEQLSNEFAQAMFPGVLQGLRAAHGAKGN